MKIPDDISEMIDASDRIIGQLKILKEKDRLTDHDMRRLAELKVDLMRLCPQARYAWIDGHPAVDILKTIKQLEKDINHES